MIGFPYEPRPLPRRLHFQSVAGAVMFVLAVAPLFFGNLPPILREFWALCLVLILCMGLTLSLLWRRDLRSGQLRLQVDAERLHVRLPIASRWDITWPEISALKYLEEGGRPYLGVVLVETAPRRPAGAANLARFGVQVAIPLGGFRATPAEIWRAFRDHAPSHVEIEGPV